MLNWRHIFLKIETDDVQLIYDFSIEKIMYVYYLFVVINLGMRDTMVTDKQVQVSNNSQVNSDNN